jgi:hypothetical protein
MSIFQIVYAKLCANNVGQISGSASRGNELVGKRLTDAVGSGKIGGPRVDDGCGLRRSVRAVWGVDSYDVDVRSHGQALRREWVD